jgi:DNA-binding NarL/FixJ family response regulator
VDFVRATILVSQPRQSRPNLSPTRPDDVASLTSREIDVLRLLDGRHTNRELAQLLSITEETVRLHTWSICAWRGDEKRWPTAPRAGRDGARHP